MAFCIGYSRFLERYGIAMCATIPEEAFGEGVSIYREKIQTNWVDLNLGLIRDIAILFSSIWIVMHILKLMILCTGVKASNGQYISFVLAYKQKVLRTRNKWIVAKKRLISCFPSFGQKWRHVDIYVVIDIGVTVAVDTATDIDGEFFNVLNFTFKMAVCFFCLPFCQSALVAGSCRLKKSHHGN